MYRAQERPSRQLGGCQRECCEGMPGNPAEHAASFPQVQGGEIWETNECRPVEHDLLQLKMATP